MLWDAIGILGGLLLVAGLALFSIPAAMMLAGVLLLAAAVLGAWSGRKGTTP